MRVVKIGLTVLVILVITLGVYRFYAPEPPVQGGQDYAQIYLIASEPTSFHLVPVQRQIRGPVSPTLALQALLNGPLAHEELFPSVPTTTKLRSLVVHEGLATADFSSDIVTDFNGGSLLESYLVEAIVNTLTEFETINQVQILVEGEIIESIGGHILINTPLR